MYVIEKRSCITLVGALVSPAILFNVLVMVSSCKLKSSASRAKVDSGELIVPENSNQVDGVFKSMTILGVPPKEMLCSGTAVSTSTALTAAHCVLGEGDVVDEETGRVLAKEYCVTNSIYKKICSREVYIDYNYLIDERSATKGANGYKNYKTRGADIAWAVFPKGTFKFIFPLSGSRALKVGDEVVMIGYSPLNIADMSKGTKRFGWNKVLRLSERDREEIYTQYGGTFDSVSLSGGDSGGPLLKDCKVVGIASGVSRDSTTTEKLTLHTNMTFFGNLITLRKAADMGAYFCGYSGDDPELCPTESIYKAIPGSSTYLQEFPCLAE
jgi:V8-like Glu-specific endopeptidase